MINKVSIILLFCLAFISQVNAQVGIGTRSPDPSAILDINSSNQGVLIPQILLDSTLDDQVIPGAAISLLVYNYNTINDVTPGFYYWDGSKWIRFQDRTVESVKCSNLDFKDGSSGFNTNLNVNPGIKAPIFATTEWNDNIFLFDVNSSTDEITVLRGGTFQVSFNIIYNRAKSGIALNGQIFVNDSPVGAVSASGFIDGKSSDNEEASISLMETLLLNANDTVSIVVSRDTSKSGDTFMTEVGTSTITITKLK